MNELFAKLGLDGNLTEEEMLAQLEDRREEIWEQLERMEDAELLRQAAEWFTGAAERGEAAAQCWLGSLYYDGMGVEQDYGRAAESRNAPDEDEEAQARRLNGTSRAGSDPEARQSPNTGPTDGRGPGRDSRGLLPPLTVAM